MAAPSARTSLRVRSATPEDNDAILNHIVGMAKETEDIDLDPATVRAGLERALPDQDRHGRYVVAEDDARRVVGTLMVSKEWSDWRGAWYWWVQSVYVEPDCRGRGVYKDLYMFVKNEARAAGDVHAVRLYVETNNERAQRVYERLGMQREDYLVYKDIL